MDPSASPRYRYRVRFAKQGDLIWVSHRDLLKLLGRSARVAGLPIDWSRGFNPRPRIAVPLALAVGVAGAHEALEVDCTAPVDPQELATRWQAALPAGIGIRAVREVPGRGKAAVAVRARYRVTWDSPPPRLADAVRALLLARAAPVGRALPRQRAKTVDVRWWLERCAARAGGLEFDLRVDDGTARPEEVLQAMGLGADQVRAAAVERVAVDLRDED